MSERRHIQLPSDKEALRVILHDALINSYRFWNDELTSASPLRRSTDRSFNEVLEHCLTSMAHWTCILRTESAMEKEHWEFGASSFGDPAYYIWIQVRPDKAQEIFNRHGLKEKISPTP